jgi:hypothetical protein
VRLRLSGMGGEGGGVVFREHRAVGVCDVLLMCVRGVR